MVKLPPEPLTLQEAATFAGLAPATLRVLLFHGKLNGVKVGQSWIISKGEMRRYMKERRPRRSPSPERETPDE